MFLVAVGAFALLSGCGGRHPSSRASSPATAAARSRPPQTPPTSCITASGYGGLGAAKNLFDANNNNTTGPGEPTPGAAWYQVVAVVNGCVGAYSVQNSSATGLGTDDMLILVSRPYLPTDAKQVVSTGRCAVWESAALQRAIGLRYAKATASPPSASQPWRAQVEATFDPRC